MLDVREEDHWKWVRVNWGVTEDRLGFVLQSRPTYDLDAVLDHFQVYFDYACRTVLIINGPFRETFETVTGMATWLGHWSLWASHNWQESPDLKGRGHIGSDYQKFSGFREEEDEEEEDFYGYGELWPDYDAYWGKITPTKIGFRFDQDTLVTLFNMDQEQDEVQEIEVWTDWVWILPHLDEVPSTPKIQDAEKPQGWWRPWKARAQSGPPPEEGASNPLPPFKNIQIRGRFFHIKQFQVVSKNAEKAVFHLLVGTRA